NPSLAINLSGNVAFTSTYGAVLGFVVNLHPAGFNLFLASDGVKATLNPQMIPVSEFGANIIMGVKIPVGKRLY
ncbi:MAG: hypothetical protein J6Q97_02035, partial [Bacteroidaceae bacterium]|nr:hypothetical protein [Bacteroidaceae bacterium]